MNNYKILNSDANQIVKLLNELGYTWTPATNDSETSLLKAYWIIAESSGELVYSSTESFIDEDSYKEISLAQLNDLVAQSKNEQGLISGADALKAMMEGKRVLYSGYKNQDWDTALNCNLGVFLKHEKFPDFSFKIVPRTIKLSIEIPAPFEPKDGQEAWCLDGATLKGYKKVIFDDFDLDIGFWRTEEEIKQVVAAWRGGIKG